MYKMFCSLLFVLIFCSSHLILAAQSSEVSAISGATIAAPKAYSETKSPRVPSTIKEFGILTGYARSKVTDKDIYETIPLIFRVGVNFDKFGLGFSDWFQRGARFFAHKDYRPAGTTEFLMEPFVSYVPSPDANAEAGFVLLIKYAWPVTERFHPYIFNGGGVMYITQHLREQSTQWNFAPQMGAGFSYYLDRDKHKALNVEYRYRHFSNANTKLPNDGVNEDFILVGMSWFY